LIAIENCLLQHRQKSRLSRQLFSGEHFMQYFLKYLSTAPVILTAWLVFTAGILIEFNRFFPDLLFHPMP
jgi:photosystem I subunit 9